jgi:hypothetical protein
MFTSNVTSSVPSINQTSMVMPPNSRSTYVYMSTRSQCRNSHVLFRTGRLVGTRNGFSPLITAQKNCAIEWGKSPEMFDIPFLTTQLASLITRICQESAMEAHFVCRCLLFPAIEAHFLCRCLLFLLLHVLDLDAIIACGESRCLARAIW